MSIEAINDPISELQAEASPEDAREIAAALVRSGQMNITDANRHLANRGAVPLVEGSLEQIKSEKARLMNDYNFRKWTQNGDPDPDAVRSLTELNAKIARANGQLTDRPAEPASAYRFDTGSRPEFRDVPDAEILKTDQDATLWAQSLQLSPSVAAELVSAARDADARPVEQREAWGSEQERLFARVVGPDYEARVEAATQVLREVSGRQKIDLTNLIRTAGAETAVTLLHQAEHLAAARKVR